MPYFVEIGGDGNSCGSWQIDEKGAIRLGVPRTFTTADAYKNCSPDAGETQIDALKREVLLISGNATELFESKLGIGEYYPRMARPSDAYPQDSPGHHPGNERISEHIANAQGQLLTLTRQLEAICQSVHPIGHNLEVFGHEIRNLLILASTEAESQWKGILDANSAKPQNRKFFTTVDYAKVSPALKLNECAVEFPYYPWMTPIFPFEKWGNTGNPTQKIAWYHAYNAVKHDRESSFSKATLLYVFQAVAACAIMICSQYGMDTQKSFFDNRLHFVNIILFPKWSPSDVYMNPYADPYTGDERVWVQQPYPF